MLLDADFAGSAFMARRPERPDRLMRMRPDWVTMVLGSEDEPHEANLAMDAEILGCIYHPGGIMSGRRRFRCWSTRSRTSRRSRTRWPPTAACRGCRRSSAS
jgi:hypothetical protein